VEKRHKIPIYKKGNLPDVSDFMILQMMIGKRSKRHFEKYEAKGFFEIDMKYVKE
jgi:hypothetical protein